MCGMGALAFMLIVRFELSGEMDVPPDFVMNEKWFDIKMLTDGSRNNERVMGDDCYS